MKVAAPSLEFKTVDQQTRLPQRRSFERSMLSNLIFSIFAALVACLVSSSQVYARGPRTPPFDGATVYAVDKSGNPAAYPCKKSEYEARSAMCGFDFTFKETQGVWDCLPAGSSGSGAFRWKWRKVCPRGYVVHNRMFFINRVCSCAFRHLCYKLACVDPKTSRVPLSPRSVGPDAAT